ncbi:MAG: outer membrane lipoprotein-sorting protein [Gammaproteobacteria bacterium]|nr:MAG: outer membrane lipoprotein-sorting protein [Pseudomonadota bacterium]PIE38253.1 MAG: outer membrane lipoprotein-sorting protein [Gammaproteobacteria bacterium]
MKRLLLAAFGCMGFFSLAQADLGPEEIVAKANIAALYSGADGRAEARMKIVDARGRTQYRQFTMLRKDIEDGGDQLFYVIFSRPSEVARTVFLVNKHPGTDDERWLYLPGLDLVKRIAAGDKRTSFVGSHFFYEDISGRDIQADTYRLLESDQDHYVIEATPKDAEAVEFSRYVITIDKSNFLPVRAEYFDKQGVAYRLAETVKVDVIDGHPTGTRLVMKDLRDGGQTMTEMRFVNYDIGVPETVFTERSMRIPPKDWIKRR